MRVYHKRQIVNKKFGAALFPAAGGGSSISAAGIYERIADGQRLWCCRLAPKCNDGGDMMFFAHGENVIFALDDVHKADRHTDDERGAQTVFDLLGNGWRTARWARCRPPKSRRVFFAALCMAATARGAALRLGDYGSAMCHTGLPIQLLRPGLKHLRAPYSYR